MALGAGARRGRPWGVIFDWRHNVRGVGAGLKGTRETSNMMYASPTSVGQGNVAGTEIHPPDMLFP